MEEKINEIHQMIKDAYPDAVSVKIFVNSDGIEVDPKFRTNLNNFSMKTITGKWVKKSR